MVIHPVLESGLLCSGRICCWLFRLVILSFDDTVHLLLLEKWGHLGYTLCIVCAIELGDGDRSRTHLVSQSSVIVASRTLQETSSSRRQKHGGMRGNRLACGDVSLWRCPPIDKRKWKCWSSAHYLYARAHNPLYGGVCSSSRVCEGVCKGVSIVSCNKTCRINIRSIDE